MSGTLHQAPFTQRVRWLETLFQAGVLRGEIALADLALVLRQRVSENPFAPAALDLVALEWALRRVPMHVGPRDVVWLVPSSQLSGEGFQRVGVGEWALATDEASARDLTLALGVLCEASRVLRERLLGDDWLTDLVHAPDFAVMLPGLAQRLDVPADALGILGDALAEFLPRLISLTQHAFEPRVRLRVEGDPTAASQRAEALWQALLAELFTARADARKIAVWMAPLWVCDAVSPYLREVSGLLLQWADQQPSLSALAESLRAGDQDAASLIAELFCKMEPRVLAERQAKEARHGISSLRDENGRTIARVVDAALLAVGRLDTRLGTPTDDALIVVLDPDAAESSYLLERLLCDVQAQYLGVELSVPARALSEDVPRVGAAGAARAVDGGYMLPFASEVSGAPVTPLALPSLSYVDVVPLGDVPVDVVFEQHSDQNAPLIAWMHAGADESIAVRRTFWVSDEGDDFASRVVHSAEAIRVWRQWLGAVTERPRGSDVTLRAREDLGLAPPTRFRV